MISPMKRYRLNFALAAPLLLLPAACPAQTAPPASPAAKPVAQSSIEEDRIFRYESAAGLLKKGRDFERAIALLRGLVAEKPQDRAYHLALGCAYACRAAAIGDACYRSKYLPEDQAKYKKWTAEWEAAQSDPNDPKYNQPAPKPPVLLTKDDSKPFTLTLDDSSKAFFDLTVKAQAAWDKTLTLSKSSAKRGETFYTQGWGRRLLRKYNPLPVKEDDLPKEKRGLLPTEKQALQDFTEATQVSPNDARYWQSLGDVLRGEKWYMPDRPDIGPVITAYQKSLKLDSNNAPLCYRLNQIIQPDKPALALDAIQHAAQADNSNAYFAYRYAQILLSKTRYNSYHGEISAGQTPKSDETALQPVQRIPETNEDKKYTETALAEFERGNKMPTCKPVIYDSCPPNLLRTAWKFEPDYGDISTEVDDFLAVTSLLAGYCKMMLHNGNVADAQRAAYALIGFGRQQVTTEINEASNKTKDVAQIKIEIHGVYWGYNLLQEIYVTTNDTAAATQAKMDVEVLRNQFNAFRKVQEEMRSSHYSSEF